VDPIVSSQTCGPSLIVFPSARLTLPNRRSPPLARPSLIVFPSARPRLWRSPPHVLLRMRQGILELRTEAGCCALGRRTGLVAAGAGGGVSWERREALEAGVGAASSAISGGSMVSASPSSWWLLVHPAPSPTLVPPVASYPNRKRTTGSGGGAP